MGRQRASFEKRRKEQARVENRQEKERKRQERKDGAREQPTGGDPDIDWIVPGPQPLPKAPTEE